MSAVQTYLAIYVFNTSVYCMCVLYIFGSIALYWAALSAIYALLSSHTTNRDDDGEFS